MPRPTRRGAILLGAGLVLVVAGAASGFMDITRGGVFAVTLVVLAGLALTLRPTRVTVHRRLRSGQLHAGRSDDVLLDARAERQQVLPGRWVEEHTFPDAHPSWAAGTIGLEGTTLSYGVTPSVRGRYRTGPLTFMARDPLGLTRRSIKAAGPTTWLVWPEVHELDTSAVATRGDGDDTLVSAHATQSGHPGASLREYALGDDMRIVHWPATAHRGELMVRQFDPPARPATAVVLVGDVPEAGTDAAWEWLVSAAASFVVHLAERGHPVALTVGDDHADSAEDVLDMLAVTGRAPVPAIPLPLTPTLLLHHTSSPDLPVAPHHQPSLALVAGPGREARARELSENGWMPLQIDEKDPIGPSVADALTAFGGIK